jgi:hypothetical protein
MEALLRIHSLTLVLSLFPGSVAISHADDNPRRSRQGTVFDSGLRQGSWKMKGIGHTLLHSFGWEEAKRSLRWCLKLDPDCAMAYGGPGALRIDLVHARRSLGSEAKKPRREG